MAVDIQLLKDSLDVSQVVGQYVTLKRSGATMAGCCPFHTEKTPSFTVFPSGAIRCWGCGWKGDLLKFVQEVENVDFRGAIEVLKSLGADATDIEELRIVQSKTRRVQTWADEQVEQVHELIRSYHTALHVIERCVIDHADPDWSSEMAQLYMEMAADLLDLEGHGAGSDTGLLYRVERWRLDYPHAVVAAWEDRKRRPYLPPLEEARRLLKHARSAVAIAAREWGSYCKDVAAEVRRIALTANWSEAETSTLIQTANEAEKKVLDVQNSLWQRPERTENAA